MNGRREEQQEQQGEGLRPPVRRSARVAAAASAAASATEEDRPQLSRKRAKGAESAPPAAAAAAAASPQKRKKPASDKSNSSRKKAKKSAAETKAESLQLEDCGICFSDDYEFSADLNSCDHVFCFACISKWGESSNTCPQCKRRFTKLEKRTRSGKKVSTKHVSKRDLGSNSSGAGIVGFEGLFPVSGLMGAPGGGVFPLHGGAALASMLLNQNGTNPISAMMLFQSILMGIGAPPGYDDDEDDEDYDEEEDHMLDGLFGPYTFGGGYNDEEEDENEEEVICENCGEFHNTDDEVCPFCDYDGRAQLCEHCEHYAVFDQVTCRVCGHQRQGSASNPVVLSDDDDEDDAATAAAALRRRE